MLKVKRLQKGDTKEKGETLNKDLQDIGGNGAKDTELVLKGTGTSHSQREHIRS